VTYTAIGKVFIGLSSVLWIIVALRCTIGFDNPKSRQSQNFSLTLSRQRPLHLHRSMSTIAPPPEPPRRKYIPGTPVPREQCPSCHFISAAVPIGLGLSSYWYFLLRWEAQARQNPPPQIRVPYHVKKGVLAVGCFSMAGYGIYRLFWKPPGSPGLF
jgi:hypothetical protein